MHHRSADSVVFSDHSDTCTFALRFYVFHILRLDKVFFRNNFKFTTDDEIIIKAIVVIITRLITLSIKQGVVTFLSSYCLLIKRKKSTKFSLNVLFTFDHLGRTNAMSCFLDNCVM